MDFLPFSLPEDRDRDGADFSTPQHGSCLIYSFVALVLLLVIFFIIGALAN